MRMFMALLLSIALVGAACAGEEAPEAETPPATPEVTPAGTPPVALEGVVNDRGTAELSDTELEMELDDFYFEPTFVRSQPGAEVTVRLHNEGQAAHTFTIEGLDIDEVLQADDERTVTVPLPDSGPVEFVCTFHEGQGMKGAFFFAEGTADAPAAGGGSGGAPGY